MQLTSMTTEVSSTNAGIAYKPPLCFPIYKVGLKNYIKMNKWAKNNKRKKLFIHLKEGLALVANNNLIDLQLSEKV